MTNNTMITSSFDKIDDECSKLADAAQWDAAWSIRAVIDAASGDKPNLPGTAEDKLYLAVYTAFLNN